MVGYLEHFVQLLALSSPEKNVASERNLLDSWWNFTGNTNWVI